MKCPVCNVDLVMSERQGVEVDYCPQCRGVWLDRGELDKIIERAAQLDRDDDRRPAPTPPPPPQPTHGGYHDDYYYKKKRRKSFLEELFD